MEPKQFEEIIAKLDQDIAMFKEWSEEINSLRKHNLELKEGLAQIIEITCDLNKKDDGKVAYILNKARKVLRLGET